jgi:hypothetical protein
MFLERRHLACVSGGFISEQKFDFKAVQAIHPLETQAGSLSSNKLEQLLLFTHPAATNTRSCAVKPYKRYTSVFISLSAVAKRASVVSYTVTTINPGMSAKSFTLRVRNEKPC